MSIRGEITIECDQKKCKAEIVLIPTGDDVVDYGKAIGIDLHADGWRWTGDSYICPQCAEANPREKGDDDGAEYGDPRDARDERRHG